MYCIVVSFWLQQQLLLFLHQILNNPSFYLSLSLLTSKTSNGCQLCTRIWLHQADTMRIPVELKRRLGPAQKSACASTSCFFFCVTFHVLDHQKDCTASWTRSGWEIGLHSNWQITGVRHLTRTWIGSPAWNPFIQLLQLHQPNDEILVQKGVSFSI